MTPQLLTRRSLFSLGFGLAGVGGGIFAEAVSIPTPHEVHLALVEGNRRFVSGHSRHPHSSLNWAKRAGKQGQHPHAVVLCCSDSRVAPEILLDQGLGDLFVIRVAGNVGNGDEIGSLEYAVEHLAAPLCVVLGHTGCGAVEAVVRGEKLPAEIERLVAPIQRAYDKVKSLYPESKESSLIRATVRLNVVETVSSLANGPAMLQEAILAGHLAIEGAVYDIETGRVEWLRHEETAREGLR